MLNIQEKKEETLELERTNSEYSKNVWRSCCLRCDKQVVQYITKYSILVGLMFFFSYELHVSETCEDKNLFVSLLTFVIGVCCPNPRIS